MSSSTTSKQLLGQYIASLAAKQPTPGGGAAAAIGAAIGAATAHMAATYTTRPSDVERGAASRAQSLMEQLSPLDRWLQVADDDAAAYADLQRTRKKDSSLSPEEINTIKARALLVPTKLVEDCHGSIVAIDQFLPHCNPHIVSDAKVGIHQLAGAARAAYQTVLVNSPPDSEKTRLRMLLQEIQRIEDKVME